MEKYNDSDSATTPDQEDTAFLNTYYQKQESSRRRTYAWLTLFNIFLFMLSTLSLICTVMTQKDRSGHYTAKLMDDFGRYSPAEHVVKYSDYKFELPNPLNSSVYVGTSNDTENAWMDIAYLPDQMITKEHFSKLGKPADTAMEVTNPVTGETGYRVGLEVFHQLHCLNLLRMSTYPDYYPKLWWSDTNDKPERVRGHLDHCIEILRMNLMCMSDINVFTFHTQPGKKGYWPDYESHHVCRNFDQIKQWANDNAMPDPPEEV